MKDLVNKLEESIKFYQTDRSRKSLDFDPLYSVKVMVNLVLLAIEENRPIEQEEESWFNGGYYIAQSFDGTEYNNIYRYYKCIVDKVRANNYFR